MIKRLLRKPVSRESFEAIVHAEGFSRTFDLAFTGAVRTTNWSRGEDVIAFVADSISGAALFIARGPAEATVASGIGAFVELESKAEVVKAAQQARTSAAKVATVLRLGLLMHDDELDEEVIEILNKRLLDKAKPVRWAASQAARGLRDKALDAGIAAAARQHADMVPAAEAWREARARDDEARARELAERAQRALFSSLPRLADEQAWSKLDEAASAALAQRPEAPSGYFYRALALDGLGQAPTALVHLHAAIALSDEQEQADLREHRETIRAKIGACTDEHRAAVVDALCAVRQQIAAAKKDEAFDDVVRGVAADLKDMERELSMVLAVVAQEGDDAEARAAIERAAVYFPERAEPLFMIAEVRSHDDDVDAALPEYRRAIALLRSKQDTSVEAARATRLYELVRSPVTLAGALDTAMRRALEHEKFVELLALADIAVATDADYVFAYQNRGVALTFLQRHDEAISAYSSAIHVMDRVFGEEGEPAEDPRGLMYFNRACERARKGERRDALSDLAEAVAFDGSWGKKARKDEYFRAYFKDPDFLRISAGFDDAPPTIEATRELIDRCAAAFQRGDAEQALDLGEDAEMAAEVLGDPALLASARKIYGHVLVHMKSPSEGIALLESAVALVTTAFPNDPGRRAETKHLLGDAYHQARAFEQAEALYREALAEHAAARGNDDFRLAKSYGDIARLESDRGLDAQKIASTIEQGRDVVRAFLKTNPSADDQEEALFDLATLSSNLCVTWLVAGEWERATVALEDAADRLSAILALGRRPSPRLIRSACNHAFGLFEKADEAQKARAERLVSRLLEILEPSPRVRAERLYWAQLRGASRALMAQGIAGAEIARAMRDALRGHEPMEPIRSNPAFANLTLELATRLGRRGDIVLIAMALSTAMVSGDIDAALEQLEGLAVAEAEAQEGVVPDDDGEDDAEAEEG